MTATVASYTFRALNSEGQVIAQSRGRAGALTKAVRALCDYRDAVELGSGRLYGDPWRLGTLTVDGIAGVFGPVGWLIGDEADAVARLDRVGVARAAQIRAEVDAEVRAA